jgi:hypothetical protein
MMERQQELQELQQQRTAVSQQHENLSVNHTLTSGLEVQVDLDYSTTGSNIFLITNSGEDTGVTFSAEDYNEMSQFLSKYNDAIFSYMTETTKDEADEE